MGKEKHIRESQLAKEKAKFIQKLQSENLTSKEEIEILKNETKRLDLVVEEKKLDYAKLKKRFDESVSEIKHLQNEILSRDNSISILNNHVKIQSDQNIKLKDSYSWKIGYWLTRIPAFMISPFRAKSTPNGIETSQKANVLQANNKFESANANVDNVKPILASTESNTSNKYIGAKNVSTVSVITPSYNQGEFLPDCLNSVKNQTVQAVEHLVYDPGSTDGSLDIAKQFKHVTLINEKDEGQADAIAKGMLRAKGDVIAWVNSDDYYADTSVFEKILNRFNQDDEPDLVYCKGYYLNEKGEKIKDAYINNKPDTLAWKLQEEVGILQPGLFIKKSVIDKLGPVNKLYHFCMDYEFWIRCMKAGMKIVFLDETTTIARYYSDNKTMGQRGKSYQEICDMLLVEFGYVHHKWLRRYAEFLGAQLDGVLNNASNTKISNKHAVHKEYVRLMAAYNTNADTLKILEEKKSENGYKETKAELQKLNLFPVEFHAQEIPLEMKRVPNKVCYTVATRRWAFSRDWKNAQIEKSKAFFENIKKQKKSNKCIIVGNGPSLAKVDFQLLKDQDVFICNNTFLNDELISIGKFYTVVNNLVAEQGFQHINRLDGLIKIFPYWLSHCINSDDNTFFVNSIGHPEFSTDVNKNVSWRHTVSFFNMQLAYGMGYDEVALIGFDHSYKQKSQFKEGDEILEMEDDANHFDPRYFKGKKWHAADVDNMEAMYILAKEAFEKAGKVIYNCTDGGHLELFKRKKLRSFIYDVNFNAKENSFNKEFESNKEVVRINSEYNHLDEGDIVLDYLNDNSENKIMINVGAHHGWGLKKFVESDWTVHGFEPDNKNRKILKSHLGKHKNLIIDDRAVSNKVQKDQSFFTSKVSTGISSLGVFHESHKNTQQVTTTTLSNYCIENNLSTCDFLLVDVEGFDLFVLEGFPWTKMQPKVVIVEFEDNKTLNLGYSYEDLGNYLLKNGYNVIISEWHPIVEYGKKHKWNRLVSFPTKIPKDSWGNLIAIRKDISINSIFNKKLNL